MSPMNPRLMRPKASGVPVFTTKGYSRVWGLTTKSSGNVTGTAETDTGYYAVKWWDNTTNVYDSGDPFSKAAAGNQRAFEVYPCDAGGVASGQFDGFDISNNALTKVRAEGVSLGSTAAVPGGWTSNYKNYNPGTPASYEGGTITNNSLSSAALDQFYTDLDSGTGHLFVAGNPGIVADTPTIATAKGYTVFGSVPPSTSLLLNFNGNNGSTTFTDSSPNAFTVTASGDAEISTAQSKFGGASAYFDGGAYLAVDNGDWFDFDVEDYTLEAWVWLDSIVTSGDSAQAIVVSTENGGFAFQQKSGGWGLGEQGVRWVHTFESAPSAQTWHHIAISRASATTRVFMDGVQQGGDFSGTYNGDFKGTEINIGAGSDGNLVGYIDDLRIVKGAALYTANFTPPASQLGVLYF